LIHERDLFLTQKILDSEGQKLVAVVGAGHVEGIRKAIERGDPVDLDEINQIPPVSRLFKWIGWGIPALILGALVTIGIQKGLDAASDNLLFWIVANGVPATVGAVVALAHPLVILSAFPVAPVTSLIPVIGAGYVLAFFQAYLAPPLVSEFESIADDFGSLRRWWGSKLLRIFLVFVLTTLGSLIGTYVGGYEIFSNLF
jgi:pheromone shutdown protein TraB